MELWGGDFGRWRLGCCGLQAGRPWDGLTTKSKGSYAPGGRSDKG